ncbi:MAG: hypothetical protein KAH96_01190 [Alphaproteobacteria bacterium]|nr:hypothetical protein [Alphaproteobacteria bacterium]
MANNGSTGFNAAAKQELPKLDTVDLLRLEAGKVPLRRINISHTTGGPGGCLG